MIKRDMTYEEVLAMVEEKGWEILEEKDYEEWGEEWTEMTILQGDHAVALGVDDKGVYEIQFVPLWAL